jgi:proline iminopeptidase
MVQGRFDLQAPLSNAWALHRAWPQAELMVVDDAGHNPTSIGVTGEIVRALDRFAEAQ